MDLLTKNQNEKKKEQRQEDSDELPRWVKIFGIIFIAFVVVFGILHLAGRGLGGHTSTVEQGESRP